MIFNFKMDRVCKLFAEIEKIHDEAECETTIENLMKVVDGLIDQITYMADNNDDMNDTEFEEFFEIYSEWAKLTFEMLGDLLQIEYETPSPHMKFG